LNRAGHERTLARRLLRIHTNTRIAMMDLPSTLQRPILAVASTVTMILFAATVAPASLAAQGSTTLSAQEREVVAVIERFFQGMLERDADMLRSTVAPSAVLVGVATRDGATTVRATPIEQFITGVTQRAGEPANERIYSPRVEIDAGMAHVWTFYTLHVGDRFSHCGYDSFQMLRMDDGWKIVSIADTRRTDNCEPPGG
jgi:hypothetical protein